LTGDTTLHRNEKEQVEVHKTLSAINRAWRSGRPSGMLRHLHPDITMKLPDFSGEVVGREKLVSSFVEFSKNACVITYSETDEQINVVRNCAVASFHFDMVYETATYRERSRGRDLWVFVKTAGKWLAVWRMMFDLDEVRKKKK